MSGLPPRPGIAAVMAQVSKGAIATFWLSDGYFAQRRSLIADALTERLVFSGFDAISKASCRRPESSSPRIVFSFGSGMRLRASW
jgi:hypothetical protein